VLNETVKTANCVLEQFWNKMVQGLFENFVVWQHCTTVMQREVVTVMQRCSGGGM
jgi:hypothetical protein